MSKQNQSQKASILFFFNSLGRQAAKEKGSIRLEVLLK
jgi:hypothetical protein